LILVFLYGIPTIMRLDQMLVFRNMYPTRAKAVAAIKAGLVSVNNTVAKKSSQIVADTDVINASSLPYSAGRGALKLERALECFNVKPNGCVCLDVGASTGGFTEVLLKNGAANVYAVDVGTNQLIPELRNDSRVVSLEQTDIRDLVPLSPVDLIVIDVSFVSLVNIVEFLPQWSAQIVIALIKPQFEVPRDVAAKFNGIIKSVDWHNWSINRVTDAFLGAGFDCVGVTESPVKGGSGNTEFLACFKLKQ
jgi:23S rRNA (cytidine1920-2'-O)/16S rRNA (cytidine1409-2'-O)-methyltransferase